MWSADLLFQAIAQENAKTSFASEFTGRSDVIHSVNKYLL